MTSREGLSRSRLRPATLPVDQTLTPLGRVPTSASASSTSTTASPVSSTSVSTTVVQNSGNIRLRRSINNPNNNSNNNINNDSNNSNNIEIETNSTTEILGIDSTMSISAVVFDAEQFRSDIKANGHDEKRLEELVLNAISYFITTAKRSPQQIADYTVLTFLAWTASLHAEVFRITSVLKAMCALLKGQTLTKAMKTFPNVNNGTNITLTATPYTLVCQILWLAFKDLVHWPDELIEAYVDDVLGEQNWIKNSDCRLFVSNIQTAFNTRVCTWKLDRSKIFPTMPNSSTPTPQISSTVNDDTSNDSSLNNESLLLSTNEPDSSIQTIDDPTLNNNSADHPLTVLRYTGRSQAIQNLLQTLLTTNAKVKSASGTSTNLNPANASTTTSASTSQPHETDKLLYLLEQLCGLPDIRLYILSRLDIWLQNPKLNRTAEKLMMSLCENLTKPSTINSNVLTNGHVVNNDLSYIDERAIEQLVNLRFKVRTSNVTSKMYILCIREMLKNDANLVDMTVRFIVNNELQQSSNLATTTIASRNPNNLPLLHACCQSQPDHTCQSLAHAIQNILLLTNTTTTFKDCDNLLKLIRPFIRELMRYAKTDFDSTRFCMYLLDMHYSTSVQQQFWAMVSQQEPLSNDITSNRLLRRLLECDIPTRERFFYAICDLIPMIILATAQAFNSMNNTTTSNVATTTRSLNKYNGEQWLCFIQRIAFIQCSSYLFYLFFLHTLPRIFDATSTLNPINYVQCLYSILFATSFNLYLRIENWPPEEPVGLRNDLFRLSTEVPLLGETLYLLIQIGLTTQFRTNPSIIIDLIDLLVRRTLTIEQKLPNDYISTYLRIPESNCEMFLRKFFDLTLYHIPIQIQLPSTYHMPKNLYITDIFWKTCLINLLLASHDPQTFGSYIWSSVPQIRLFMEMLLTGDYTYPPKSMIETKDFLEKFYAKERIQSREEKDSILELEKHLASPNIINEKNSQLLGKVILFDLQHIKRPLSYDKTDEDFYTLIQGFNNAYKLSSMLCRCRSPDFILNILNRKQKQGNANISHSQTSWLTSLIDSNIDCLSVFPIICLCDYFQHIIMIYNNNTTKTLPSKKAPQALETILTRFKCIINHVKQHIASNTPASSLTSSFIDDMICILNYFFSCLNSNISTVRSNAWLCLHIIFHEQNLPQTMENLQSKFDQSPETYIESILASVGQFQCIDHIPLLVKQRLSETCCFETNIHLLHYSILFIIDNCSIDTNNDLTLLANLAQSLNHRHSILYLIIQYDKQEKKSKLIERFFYFITKLFIVKLQQSLKYPITITSDEDQDENLSSITQSYLMLPHLNPELIQIIKQLQTFIHMKDDFHWTTNKNKQYLQIDSILIELLLILLAYFDFNNSATTTLHDLAELLQNIFLDANCVPSFVSLKRSQPPIPIKQTSEEITIIDDNEGSHFKQFAIDDADVPEAPRKRRLSHSTATEKVFITSSSKTIYRLVSINNEHEQSLFHSDDLQYFIFKSNNFVLVKHCIDQASFSTCLKMFKISATSHENMNYLCQRLNQLIDSSSKQIHTYIKQSSFILPLVNRWIMEQLPEAVKLGEKLKKITEKKKKLHTTSNDSNQEILSKRLCSIPTSSRVSSSTLSITEQVHMFDSRINGLCNTKSSVDIAHENLMEIDDININIPWSNLGECEVLLKCLVDKKIHPLKRRQWLIKLQGLMNVSDDYHSQLCQTMMNCCSTTTKAEFYNHLKQQYNISLVLLSMLMKNRQSTDDYIKLITLLSTLNDDDGSVFSMKMKQLKRTINQSKESTDESQQNQCLLLNDEVVQNVALDHMFHIFAECDSLSDSKLERQFSKYFKLNNRHPNECQQLLMNILVQAECKLSEPSIGMILDYLEKMNYQSSGKSSNNSIYANHLLFLQRTESSISQRLLLKQFLHSCDWSTILNGIHDLLTLDASSSDLSLSSNDVNFKHNRLMPTSSLKQSQSSLINHRDSTLILDMLEAFIKLSPLWSGREFKMLDRCHDELLIDLNEKRIYTLIIYILDEGYRRHLSNENLYEQYQKRYETILYHLIQNTEKKTLLQYCLQQILINSNTHLWIKNVLTSFYFIIYINQPDLFNENFYFIIPNLFSELKQQYKQINFINTNYDYVIHDLLVRLNSYDIITMDNIYEVNILLRQYVSKYPILFLRHLNIIKLNLQSRLSTVTNEELNRRNSKQRTFFLSLFDLIYRLRPYIYDSIYENDFQSIIDIFIRFIHIQLPTLNTCTKQNMSTYSSLHDLLYLIDRLLSLIHHYLSTTINSSQRSTLLKTYNNKLFEKIHEKLQTNKELHQYLLSHKHNYILYHHKQLKILYDAVRIDDLTDSTNVSNEIVPFNVRLSLVDNTASENNHLKQSSSSDNSIRHKSIDIQYYLNKLSISIDKYTSSTTIDELSLTLNELKSYIDYYLSIDHVHLILDSLASFLLNGNKQLIDQTYEFILKYMEKYPQHSSMFYSTYVKCILSTNLIVFQMAIEHFSHFVIYFQSKANELFYILLKQGFINKTDVTTCLTQAIRLLNLHRCDPITYNNLSSAIPSKIMTTITAPSTTSVD